MQIENIKTRTVHLIDELKSTCQTYGMGNDGNEYKIITQVFLYKFLNDKFCYELKQLRPEFNKEDWEKDFENMSEDDIEDLFDELSPDIPRFYPHHLISYLWNRQTDGEFHKLFDDTMTDIAAKNIDIFSTQTTNNTKMPLFETLTNYVTDEAQRPAFSRALVDKLVRFSFEDAFQQHYDFFASIFEYLIKDYNTAGGGKYAEYYTPHAIATIMARLLVGDNSDLHNIECYDPSAGTGTLLMALAHQIGEDRCTIFSQDISQKSNKMLKLNLILNGLVSSMDHAIQGDTLVSPYHKSDDGQTLRTFDYVVSNPPFKMDFSDTREAISDQVSRFWAGVPKIPDNNKEKMAIYTCFIQHVINSLKDNGKGAIVVPTGFLTAKNGIENKVLKSIVDDGIVYGCIKMPANVFANTGTNVSVLFFDKSKNNKSVLLIDATNLGEEYKDGKNTKRRLNLEEIDLITNAFLNEDEIDKFSMKVSYQQIKDNKYSLSAGQYFVVNVPFDAPKSSDFNKKKEMIINNIQNCSKRISDLNFQIQSITKMLEYREKIKMIYSNQLKRNIPQNWIVKSINDIAYMKTESITPQSGVIYDHYSIPAFDDNKLPIKQNGDEIDSNKYCVPNNSILISKLNPQFSRVWVPFKYADSCICSTEFIPFVPFEESNKGFLYMIFSSDEFQQYMTQSASSSTGSRKRISPELIGKYKFPFPEDKEILAKYNELFSLLLELEKCNLQLGIAIKEYNDSVVPLIARGYIM